MTVAVSVQRATADHEPATLPADTVIQGWVEAAVRGAGANSDACYELTVRIVDEQEIVQLNSAYRHKQGPTNVLSFPFEVPPGMPDAAGGTELGDLVICAQVVEREAREQHKSSEAHWAHMVVHGTLHLLGFDHINEQQAQEMEGREKNILAAMGFDDPYGD